MKGNILKISTLSPTFEDHKTKGPEPAWYDPDTLLLHASFQILIDFIEKEKPEKHINWNSDEMHKNAWKEIKTLYKYWKKDRDKLQAIRDKTDRKSTRLNS